VTKITPAASKAAAFCRPLPAIEWKVAQQWERIERIRVPARWVVWKKSSLTAL